MNKGDIQKLCELHADMKWVKATLGNHLRHHERYEIALVTGILFAVFGLVIGYFIK
jgi:hypothetical protein